jgi:ubiquinone/menaquinone biosynthesis C-methylase UbiE
LTFEIPLHADRLGRHLPDAVDRPASEGDPIMTTIATFDPMELEAKVKAMYRSVAENPHGDFHFEMGRAMAERLGYAPADLDRIPAEAVDSFAGVGYYFHLADLGEGETVVDLGSGSGMDSFIATLKVGARGKVFGIDMTDEQRAKAERLRVRDGFTTVKFLKGYIEEVPLPDSTADAVISNGVINLPTDKTKVFREAARLLKPGGRLALSDIVTEVQLPETIVCNSTLWAACIGGAAQQDNYRRMIEAAGLRLVKAQDNPQYQFISDNAKGASKKFGVKSVSLLARKA